jgi:uncharacterized membrane protein YqgA involved in biofilm formation
VTGTLVNVGTVLAGGTIGTLVGGRFPRDLRRTLTQAVGLTTILIGLRSALTGDDILLILASVALGATVGEALRIEDGLEGFGRVVERRFARRNRADYSVPQAPGDEAASQDGPDDGVEAARRPGDATPTVARGFVTASLIFCVGPMTILGSFEDGLTGAYQTLALKATLDGITAAVLASTLGWGVLLSAATVLVYQGALTLGAGALRGLLTDAMVGQMTAVGGLLILGIGINILELARLRVGNMLPALAIAPALAALTKSGT